MLILESSRPDTLGDVSLFRTSAEAAACLEAIDVRNNEYFAYTLDGRRLTLTADAGSVYVALAADTHDYAPVVRKLLEAWVLISKKKAGEQKDVSQMTLDELVARVGYDATR